MIKMPSAYKTSMHERKRNRSYLSVNIGVVNQAAQVGASVSRKGGSEYSYLSDYYKLFDNYKPTIEYATFEEDFIKTNGSMLFPPRPQSSDAIFNAGLISAAVKGSIAIEFDNVYNIRGLTIDFGEKYPVDFTVTNGIKTVEFTGNDKSYWTTEEIFDHTSYFIITPSKMVNGNGRLRIHTMIMGVGIGFTNKQIISSEKSEFVSSISEELPTMDFTLEAENQNRVFDVDNSESAINYLEIGQEVSVKYGYEINDDGNITWINGCVCRLSDWEADDETVRFTATDRIDLLNDTYYRGVYLKNGISLYDLAVDVLTDAGLDEREYDIDQYLKSVTIYNPLPCVSHKECLQLIANAGRCKLYNDRDGLICIKAAFETTVSPERMIVSSESAESWCDLSSVINNVPQYEYATFSQNHIRTNGTQYFLPKSGNYLTVGFVSKAVSNSDGIFARNPKFKITLEAAMTYFGLQINFSSNPPESMTIHAYYEGALQESYTPDIAFELENKIEHEFPIFDEIEFEFTKGQPNSRIFAQSVVFGDMTDYRMDYRTMLKSPLGKQMEKVQRVDVLQNIYSENSDVANIFQEHIDVSNITAYTFYFSVPTYDVFVTANGNEVSIIDSSSYYVTVDVTGINQEMEFIVTGREYLINNKVRSKIVNPTGVIEQWDNPLISTLELADLQAEWLGNYFANNIEYDISYRGEPRLDAGDLMFLERRNMSDTQIQIYEHSLSFNGALSGTVKARKAVAQSG